jgi:hypothetical protein
MTMMEGLDVKYLFSITAPFATRWIGKTPAGFRLDLDYASDVIHGPGGGRGPKVTTDLVKLNDSWPNVAKAVETILGRAPREAAAPVEEHDEPAARKRGSPKKSDERNLKRARDLATEEDHAVNWFGLTGTVAAGMDWAQLRPDGVVDFDGRLTLRDEEGTLVNAVVLGSVDLIKPGNSRPLTLDEAVEHLREAKNDEVGFALALRFETVQEPEPWAAKRYRRVGALKYRRLSRGQCLGVGRLKSFTDSSSRFLIDVVSVAPNPSELNLFGLTETSSKPEGE